MHRLMNVYHKNNWSSHWRRGAACRGSSSSNGDDEPQGRSKYSPNIVQCRLRISASFWGATFCTISKGEHELSGRPVFIQGKLVPRRGKLYKKGNKISSSHFLQGASPFCTPLASSYLNMYSIVSKLATLAILAASMSMAMPLEPRATAKVYSKCSKPGTYALTFDDGPYEYTWKLADDLKAAGVKATFFINGNNWV